MNRKSERKSKNRLKLVVFALIIGLVLQYTLYPSIIANALASDKTQTKASTDIQSIQRELNQTQDPSNKIVPPRPDLVLTLTQDLTNKTKIHIGARSFAMNITTLKIAHGDLPVNFFVDKGLVVPLGTSSDTIQTSFDILQNGIYTVYAQNSDGGETVGKVYVTGLSEPTTLVDLHAVLEEVMTTKNYSAEVKDVLRETLDTTFMQYNDLEQVYSVLGLPTKAKYIFDNFVSLFDKNIDTIGIHNPEDPAWQQIIPQESWGVRGLYLMSDRAFHFLRSDSEVEQSLVFHEIFHSSQQNILQKYDEMYLYYIFVEGGAVTRTTVVDGVTLINHGGMNLQDISRENYFVSIRSNGAFIQGVYGNFFEKLQLLVGYQAMEQYKVDGDIDKIKHIIDSKYGTGTANKILNNMKIIYDYSISDYSDKLPAFNAAIALENTILKALQAEISTVNSREKATDYLNFYRMYKEKLLIKYYEDIVINNGSTVTYYTNEKLNIDSLEQLLVDKLNSYIVLPTFSDDPVKNEAAIRSLFETTRDSLYGPYNLYNVEYKYHDQTGELEIRNMVGGTPSEGYKKLLTVPDKLAAPVITAPIDGTTLTDGSVTVTGTSAPGASVKITVTPDTVIPETSAPVTATVSADSSGNWSAPIEFPEGAGTISATQQVAGVTSPSSAPIVYRVDSIAPTAPIVTQINSESLAISGTGESDATVTVTFSGGITGTAVVGTEGDWSTAIPTGVKLEVGDTVTVTQADRAGNVSPVATVTVTAVADTTAPIAPAVDPIEAGATKITGTGEAGATVTADFPGGSGTVIVESNGKWTVLLPTSIKLKAGDVVTVTQADRAGNVSPVATVTVTAVAVDPIGSKTVNTGTKLPKTGDNAPLMLVVVLFGTLATLNVFKRSINTKN